MNDILAGQITKTHGLKGDLVFMSQLEHWPDVWQYGFFLDSTIKIKTNKLVDIKRMKYIISLEGINNIEQAHGFIRRSLFVPKEKLSLFLEEGQLFISDLINKKLTWEGKEIAILLDINNYGALDIYSIQCDRKIDVVFGPEDIESFSENIELTEKGYNFIMNLKKSDKKT